jgi:hypothetical protein
MTKTLNQIIFLFLHQNQNIFFSNIGNQNIFLEKNHNPPLQVKWSFPYGAITRLKIIYIYVRHRAYIENCTASAVADCLLGTFKSTVPRDCKKVEAFCQVHLNLI